MLNTRKLWFCSCCCCPWNWLSPVKWDDDDDDDDVWLNGRWDRHERWDLGRKRGWTRMGLDGGKNGSERTGLDVLRWQYSRECQRSKRFVPSFVRSDLSIHAHLGSVYTLTHIDLPRSPSRLQERKTHKRKKAVTRGLRLTKIKRLSPLH